MLRGALFGPRFRRYRAPPDLIILGVGERMTARLDPALVKHLGSKGIRVEQMDTVSVCDRLRKYPALLLYHLPILVIYVES